MTAVDNAASSPVRVASSATSVTLRAANARREGLTIFNESTAVLYVKFGAVASLTDYSFQLGPGSYYETPATPTYVGQVDGVWVSANGAAQVTELV